MNASAAFPAATEGSYAIFEEIAAGGMATVHLGRRVGPVSFSRMVAIKRLHAHLAREPEVVAMFLDEARVAARIRHPNVVPTLDIVTTEGLPFLVMEYVQGESLARLLAAARARQQRVSVHIACSVVVGLLQGLHAAHEATGEGGESLRIVHRDVSPQNVMVGLDGVTRVLDFGVAKAAGRLQTTREGKLKGKLAYTAPELVRGAAVTRAADIYSAGVVLWETLTGERLFAGDNEANVLERVLFAEIAPPSRSAKDLDPALDAIVLKALARDPARRFPTARDMARAIEAVVPVAGASEVGEWVAALARDALAERNRKAARIQSASNAADGDGATLERGETEARKASRRPVALAIAALAFGVAAFIFLLGPRNSGHRAPAAAATAFEPSVTAAAVQPVSPVQSPAAPPTGGPPTISADDLPPAPSTPKRTAPTSPAGAPPRPRDPTAAAVAAKAGLAPAPGSSAHPPSMARSACDPPWTIDSRGIKQYKLECL